MLKPSLRISAMSKYLKKHHLLFLADYKLFLVFCDELKVICFWRVEMKHIQPKCFLRKINSSTKQSNLSNIPWRSGFKEAFASIPTTLTSTLGLPRMWEASICIKMSEVLKPMELRNRALLFGELSMSLGPECSLLASTNPSKNSASSSMFSGFKLIWKGRPMSTDTSAEMRTTIYWIYCGRT